MAGEYKGSAGRVPVDANGTSLADTTTSALKVVSVDSSGTALAGGGGSRVELLATGTDTTINSTSTLLFSTASGTGANVIAALPTWCHTIQFEYRIDSTTGGSPTNLQIVFGGTDTTGQTLAAGTWIATTASTVAASQSASLLIGRNCPAVAYSVTNAGTTGALAYGAFLPRNFKITRLFGAAPTTTLSSPWRLYCIGG